MLNLLELLNGGYTIRNWEFSNYSKNSQLTFWAYQRTESDFKVKVFKKNVLNGDDAKELHGLITDTKLLDEENFHNIRKFDSIGRSELRFKSIFLNDSLNCRKFISVPLNYGRYSFPFKSGIYFYYGGF